MSKLFKIKKFLITEGILLFLMIIDFFVVRNALGTFGICGGGDNGGNGAGLMKCGGGIKCISVEASCAEYYGLIFYQIILGLFVLYLIIFVIYKLINLFKGR